MTAAVNAPLTRRAAATSCPNLVRKSGSSANSDLIVLTATSRPAAERPAYEQARDELTELVKRLEAGGLTLEQSLELWERGERLAVICEEWLEGARARLAAAVGRQDDGQGHHAPDEDPARPF